MNTTMKTSTPNLIWRKPGNTVWSWLETPVQCIATTERSKNFPQFDSGVDGADGAMGPYLNDVRHGSEKGGTQKVDIVREVEA